MPKPPTPRQWIRAVQSCPHVTDADRVLAIELYFEMRADRMVSVPRATLAERLKRSERRIAERVANLHSAGLLSTVENGYRGHTAVYQGLIPTAESVTICSTHLGTGIRHPNLDERPRNGGRKGDTRGSHQYKSGPVPRGAGRDVGSEEQQRERMPFDRGLEHGEDESRRSA